MAVNDGADALDAGDVLLIPAVYHEPPKHVHSRRDLRREEDRSRGSSRKQAARQKTASRDAVASRSSSPRRSAHRQLTRIIGTSLVSR